MTLPKIRGGWREEERGGVALIFLCGMKYIWLKKVCFALKMTEAELLKRIKESGAEKYPCPPELAEGA